MVGGATRLNLKSWVKYRHRWPWMTLNGVIAFISPKSIALQAYGVTVLTIDLQNISSSTFGHNWPTLQRGLSAIA